MTYYGQNILLRITEPERVVSFRVAWIDDKEENKLTEDIELK